MKCVEMFESGSNLIELHMEKIEFHILFKIQQTYQFLGIQDQWYCGISLDYTMYEGMGLAFNQEHQALYLP